MKDKLMDLCGNRLLQNDLTETFLEIKSQDRQCRSKKMTIASIIFSSTDTDNISTLEVTHGRILRQNPTDATSFWWHWYGS